MKRKGLLITLLACALSVSVACAFAHAEVPYKKDGRRHKQDTESKFYKKAYMLIKNQDQLGLSDEQVDKVEGLKLATKKALLMKKAEIEVLGLDIKAGLYKDEVDAEALNRLIDQKYELKKEKMKTLVDAYAELKGLLNKDQKERLKELYKERTNHFKISDSRSR